MFSQSLTLRQVIPPDGSILRPRHRRALPLPSHNRLPNRSVLRPRRHMALLGPPSPPLGAPIQKYPQNPPSILGALRPRRRIRLPNRSLSARARHRRRPNPMVCHHRQPTHPNHVPMDHAAALPGHRRPQRLRVSVELASFPPLLGGRRSSRCSS